MLDLNKTLELLKLPQDMASFSGQIQKCTRHSIVENRLNDFTYVNMDTLKKEIKLTSTFSTVSTTVPFGAYTHNKLVGNVQSQEVVGFIDNVYYLHKDGVDITISQGPFAGQTYHFGWSDVQIVPTEVGLDIIQLDYPWGNSDRNSGMPKEPWISLKRIDQVKTGSVSIIRKTKEVKVTNVSISKGVSSFPNYTKEQMLEKSGMTEEELAEAKKTVFHCYLVDPATHVVSMATDIEVADNKLTGVAYINGIKSSDIPYTTLMASYGKKFPDFVTRWKVYHPSMLMGVYGTALPVIQQGSKVDNSITIIKGDALSFNATTRVLTYIDGTEIVFDIECLPAQGKNESTGTKMNLDTFNEEIF